MDLYSSVALHKKLGKNLVWFSLNSQESVSRAAICLSKIHTRVFLSNRKLKSVRWVHGLFTIPHFLAAQKEAKKMQAKVIGWGFWECSLKQADLVGRHALFCLCPISTPCCLEFGCDVWSYSKYIGIMRWPKDRVLVLMMAESRIEGTVMDGLWSCYINPGLAAPRFLFTCKKSLISFLFRLL